MPTAAGIFPGNVSGISTWMDTQPPVRRFRDPGPRHAAFETQILCHVDPAQLGNPDAMITQLELIIGEIEAGFASLLAFEAWAASLFLEESRKRLAQIKKGLVRSVLGHFPRPGEELPPDLVELLLEFERGRFLACLILSIPFRQRPVPHKAARSRSTGKVVGLFRTWDAGGSCARES